MSRRTATAALITSSVTLLAAVPVAVRLVGAVQTLDGQVESLNRDVDALMNERSEADRQRRPWRAAI